MMKIDTDTMIAVSHRMPWTDALNITEAQYKALPFLHSRFLQNIHNSGTQHLTRKAVNIY